MKATTGKLSFFGNRSPKATHSRSVQKFERRDRRTRKPAARSRADFLWGSGLQADLDLPPGVTTAYGGTGIPNGEHLPYYTQVNTGITHVFQIPGAGSLTARFDVMNVFDEKYEIRNGTGVGVGAPQFGPRRGIFFGLSKSLGS